MSLRYPALALAFALVLAGYCIWDLDQLSGRRSSLVAPRVALAGLAAPGAPPRPVSPCCQAPSQGPPRQVARGRFAASRAAPPADADQEPGGRPGTTARAAGPAAALKPGRARSCSRPP